MNPRICVEFCFICFINSDGKYDIVLRNVNTLASEFVAIQVKGSFLKVMANTSIHKDIPQRPPTQLWEFHFGFAFLFSHKSQGGPWLVSHKALKMLNLSRQDLEHRISLLAPLRGFSACTYNLNSEFPRGNTQMGGNIARMFSSCILTLISWLPADLVPNANHRTYPQRCQCWRKIILVLGTYVLQLLSIHCGWSEPSVSLRQLTRDWREITAREKEESHRMEALI